MKRPVFEPAFSGSFSNLAGFHRLDVFFGLQMIQFGILALIGH